MIAGAFPSNPLRAQQLRLRQHCLHGFLLQVRRVAVFVQDALHHDFNLARALSRSVQSIVTLWRTLVINSPAMTLSLSSPIAYAALTLVASAIVKRDFIIGQTGVHATLGGGFHSRSMPSTV